MSETLVWTAHLPDVPILTPARRQMLLASSLTAALRAEGSLRVEVRRQDVRVADAETLRQWGCLHDGGQVYVREVCLHLDDAPVVWAVSACAPDDGFWVPYLRCGTQPLGEKLFGGHDVLTRTPLHYAFGRISGCLHAGGVWARRSVFAHGGQTLALLEAFLPAWYEKIQ